MEKRNASARRLFPATDHFDHFHKDEFDEMFCELDSSEYARSFEQNQTLGGHEPEEEHRGGCSLGRVRSDETLGTDVVVRSLY